MAVGVTLLGPNIDHRRSLETMLGADRPVNWAPDSNSFLRGRDMGWWERMQHKVERLLGTRRPDYLAHVGQALQANNSQVVVAYWGTEPLADLVALRRLRPDVKLVLMVLCYPVALDAAGIQRQNWMMRRATRLLDGILFPGPQPEGLPDPNVVFIGRTDLSAATVHKADDLRPMMLDLLNAGIELHHGRSKETDDGHPLRRPFSPVAQDQLIERMACHDASLIAYNLEACQNEARFELTVPDRLLSSVAAGVPIAVPQQGYTGLKQYLAGHEALIEFESPQALLRQLKDRGRVREMRQAAWHARERFTAERHGPVLRAYIDSLT